MVDLLDITMGQKFLFMGGGWRHSHARLIPLLCCFLLSVLLRKRWFDGRLYLDLFSLLFIVFSPCWDHLLDYGLQAGLASC